MGKATALQLSVFLTLMASGTANMTAHAQPSLPYTLAAQTAFDQPANAVLALLQRSAEPANIFTPAFLTAVPSDQLAQVISGLREQFGTPLAVDAIEPMDIRSAKVDIRYEKAVVTLTIGVQDGKLSGLFVTGTRTQDDSIADIAADIAGLPGRSGFVVQRLDGTGAQTIASANADERFAIASVFKLYVLAEIDRAVRAGERSWTDVLPLTQKSHPSGISQDWPDSAPMTLQTLATLMVSISDNSATDTLITALGEPKLSAMVRASGHGNPQDMLPLLTTQQVTGLKMPANAALRERLLAADEHERVKILAQSGDVLRLPKLDLSVYTDGPNQIDTVEWFASPADIARLLAMLNREGDPVTRAILKVNAGIPPVNAGRWAYLGYKGGSEPGIMAMSFLARNNQDETYIVSAVVNDPAADTDQPRFIQLMTRLLDLLAASDAPSTRP